MGGGNSLAKGQLQDAFLPITLLVTSLSQGLEPAFTLSIWVKRIASKKSTHGPFSEEDTGPSPHVHEASPKCLIAPEATELLTMALSSSLGLWVPLYPRTCLPLPAGFCFEDAARMTGEATSSEATFTFYGSTLLSPGPSWVGAWNPYSDPPAGLCSSVQGSSGCRFPSKRLAHHHCFRWLLREVDLGKVLRLHGIGQHA